MRCGPRVYIPRASRVCLIPTIQATWIPSSSPPFASVLRLPCEKGVRPHRLLPLFWRRLTICRRALPRRTGASRMLRPPSRLFPSARASLFIPKAHFGATGLRPFKIGGFRVAAHAISWRWKVKTCFRCVGRRACRTDKTLSHMRQSLALIVDKRWACADSLPDGGDSSSSRSGFPGLGEHSLQGHAMVTKKFFPSHFPVSDQ